MICSQCGVCCKLFVINLSEEEYKSGNYKTQFEEFGIISDFKEAGFSGANIITQKQDGSCIYQKDNKCSIHKTRPAVCRKFFCIDNNFKSMIDKINEYKNKLST
jgi:Fe-S-cluster containining protein